MEEQAVGRTKVKYWYIKVGEEYVVDVAVYSMQPSSAKKFPSQMQAQYFVNRCYWLKKYKIDCVMENVAEEHEKRLGKNAFKL